VKTGKPKTTAPSRQKTSELVPGKFPIAAIGASAGGLEALEQFLGNVPVNSGIGFVVIHHLDPTHKGILPELLQRISKIKVFQVKDRMPVKPNCVYVIPPNTSMSILGGVLHLFEPIEARGLRLPIDFFFKSLASDQLTLGIGIILSGMGSDGSSGIRAIKEKNGIVLVQEPATAKYDSMPRNAIEAVLVDIVAPAAELPEKLIALLSHLPLVQAPPDKEFNDQGSLDKIIILLRNFTGNDFSLYKKNTIYRRIERRMGVHKIEKIRSYVRFLQENPKEVDILFKELLIGVTSFFRDPLVWEHLKERVFPAMFAGLKPGSVFRAWIPGCSTGEEAYTLAIVLKETLEKINPHGGLTLQLFATDLDAVAIETARKGEFAANIAKDVSQNRLNRFFIATEEGFRIKTEIREIVVFAQHNIIMHPPFTKLDILSCRNLLIYMDSDLQYKLLGLFYYSLNPGGMMVLGGAETPGAQNHLFSPVSSKLKIYKRVVPAIVPELLDFPSSFSRIKPVLIEKQMPAKSPANIQTLADQLLLQYFAPAGVLVNESGDIVYFSGRTGKYLEPAVGKANLNIFAMLRDGLRNEFPMAFRKALLSKGTASLQNISLGANGNTQAINVSIQWIEKPQPLNGMVMIIFTDAAEVAHIKPGSKKRVENPDNIRQSELEQELKNTREEMQTTLEEMQTSQEELKSTNEELQSTNEELQSSNEELTTSKEEMQSLNEELQTLNAELQSKVDDFSRVNNDMKNLLNSTDIATLFLDKELNIRRYTNQATKIFKLIKSDIGRPFTDQVSDLVYPNLAADALEVLHTLIFIEKQIPTKDGRWFIIRIMPYRTFDDRIDGLVITFINYSMLKQFEIKLQETEKINQLLFNSSPEVIIHLSADLKIKDFSPGAEKFFNKKRADMLNQNYIDLLVPRAEQKKTGTKLLNLIETANDGKVIMQVNASGGLLPEVEWSVKVLRNDLNQATGIIMGTK
jgi:two-component system CheB/CheR fusion protein